MSVRPQPKDKQKEKEKARRQRPMLGCDCCNPTTTSSSSMQDDTSKMCVWVVGGGFAGLAVAAALRRTVGRVEILERMPADDYYRAHFAGAASQLGPNGLLALERIGGKDLVQKIIDDGDELTHIGMVVGPGGLVSLIPDTSREDTGMPQLLIQWRILRKHLQDLVPPESIHTSVHRRIAGYEKLDKSGSLSLVDAMGDPILKDIPGPDLIIAADGEDSLLRESLEPFDKDPEWDNIKDNGRVNIKAVVKQKIDYEAYGLKDSFGNTIPPGTALAYNAANWSISCFAGAAGLGHSYWAVSVADRNQERILSEDDDRADIKRKLVAMVAVDDECRFIVDLIEHTPTEAIYVKRSRQLKRVGPSFVSPDASLVVVGDAAHAMSPAYGQGANFAFEDAATLAICLANNKAVDTRSEALNLYSTMRVSRCEEMLRRSAERAAKQAKGERTEEVFKWISGWEPPTLA